jgi:hypothetical protein
VRRWWWAKTKVKKTKNKKNEKREIQEVRWVQEVNRGESSSKRSTEF